MQTFLPQPGRAAALKHDFTTVDSFNNACFEEKAKGLIRGRSGNLMPLFLPEGIG